MPKLKYTKIEKFLSNNIHPTFPLVIFILFCFVIIQILIRSIAILSPFTGYIYVILIALTTLWFGLEGGFLSATLASFIYLAELKITHGEILDSTVMSSLYIIFLIYYLCGIILGYISGKENRLKKELKKLAQYDELTGCLNYRWTMQLLEQEINLCRRYNRILSMVLLDIDFFKKINDTYGHLIGNDILKSFAECIKKNLRNADIVGRYGGEEFLIILPETTPDFAATILERIKEKLQHIKIDPSSLDDATEVSIKFSAGIVSCPNNARELKGLIGMADYALLKAKNLGRNRWILEKRKAMRFKPAGGLKITLHEPKHKTPLIPLEIIDISEVGMQLLLSKNLNNVKHITCRVFFPGQKNPAELKCETIHILKTNDGLYRTGLSFINPTLSFQITLLKTAYTQTKISEMP